MVVHPSLSADSTRNPPCEPARKSGSGCFVRAHRLLSSFSLVVSISVSVSISVPIVVLSLSLFLVVWSSPSSPSLTVPRHRPSSSSFCSSCHRRVRSTRGSPCEQLLAAVEAGAGSSVNGIGVSRRRRRSVLVLIPVVPRPHLPCPLLRSILVVGWVVVAVSGTPPSLLPPISTPQAAARGSGWGLLLWW
jgi:hypothetical protein